MPNIRMPDGKVVSFPNDLPQEEIKKVTQQYIKKLQKEDYQDKELDDESIGVGESITNKSSTLGSRVYNMYKYAPKAGWDSYEALAQQAFASLPGLFLTAEEQKHAATKDTPLEEGGKVKQMLGSWYKLHKDQQKKEEQQSLEAKKKAGTGFTQSVLSGISAAPGTIALFAPAVVAGGPVAGFAGMNMLLESEKKEGETGLEYAQRTGLAGVEGGITGKLLTGLNMFGIPTRLVGMGAVGASGPAENAEERIANATTYGILGIVGPKITAKSKIDIATEHLTNKTKQYLDTQKAIGQTEKAIGETKKSLAAVIDQHTSYERQTDKLIRANLELNKKKERAKEEQSKADIDSQIQKNVTTITSLNASKGKLKGHIDSISSVIRDNELFSSKYMRDFDTTMVLTPTEAKLLFVKGVNSVIKKKRKNKDGKYEVLDENTIRLVANTKKMTPIKADTIFGSVKGLFTKGGRRFALPAKFLGDYPVAKYGVDLVSKHIMEVDMMTKLFLENPKAYKKLKLEKIKGFNPLRYSSLTPTEGGALVSFSRLKEKDKLKVMETMETLNNEYTLYRQLRKEERLKDNRFDNKTGEATTQFIESLGISQEGILAMRDIQTNFNGLQKMYNDYVNNFGGPNISKINKRPNYFPQIYMGDFKVFVNDGKGNLLGVYGAPTIKQANKIAAEISKKSNDLVINVRSKTLSEVKDYSAEMFQDVMALANRSKLNKKSLEALDAAVVQMRQQKGFNIRKIQRRGKITKGYLGTYGSPKRRIEDFVKAVTVYTNGAIQTSLRMKLAKEFTDFYNTPLGKNVGSIGKRTLRDLYPTDFHFADTFKKNATGLPINVMVEKMRGSPLGSQVESMTSKWYMKSANLANTWFLLALNPRFLMLQGIQPFQMIPHKLAGMTAELRGSSMIDATAHAYHSMAVGTMKTFKPEPFNIALNKSAVRQGVITEAMLKEYLGESYYAKGKINTKGLGKKIFGTFKGTVPAGFMERFTRLQAVNVVGEHMLTLGYSRQFVLQQAPYLANKLMVEYHASQRPLIFSMAGAMSRPFGLFKTYAQNNYAQTLEAIQKAKFERLVIGKRKLPIPIPKGQTTQLANFIGSQAIFGGLKGVVGLTGVDAIIKAVNAITGSSYGTLSDGLIKMGLPDVFMFGAPSTTLQADMSSSLQAPTTDPTELITAPSIEFAMGAASGILELTKHYLNHKLGEQLTGEPLLDIVPVPSWKVRDAWKKVTPTSWHGIIEQWYQANDNPYYIKNSTANFRREEADWWARKYLAMRSLRESKYFTFNYMMQKQIGSDSKTKSDIVKFAVDAYIQFNGDIEQAWQGYLYDAAEKAGFKNPKEFHKAIKRGLESTQRDFFEKMEKGGVTEEEMEIYENAEKLGIVGDK